MQVNGNYVQGTTRPATIGTDSNLSTLRKCPPGYAITGVKGDSAGLFDRLTGFYCQDIRYINNPKEAPKYVEVTTNVDKNNKDWKCATGTALSRIDYTYSNDDWAWMSSGDPASKRIGSATFRCGRVPGTVYTGQYMPAMTFGWNSGGSSGRVETPDQYTYLTGLAPIYQKNESGYHSVGAVYTTGQKFMSELDARTVPSEQAKCSIGTRILNCFDSTPGTPTAQAFMAGYCGKKENAKDPSCMKWCGDSNNSGFCDAAVVSYCANGNADPYCSCINSPAGQSLAKCADGNCVNSGYLTTNMQKTACPALITCTTQAALQNSGVSLAQGVTVQQNCGSTTVTNPGGSTVEIPPGGSTTIGDEIDTTLPPVVTQPPADTENTNDTVNVNYIMIVLVFIFVVMCAVIGVYYFKPNKTPLG
ncbi:hypothetical protein PV-S19_0003 [Pacmanvirus S19]|nr:hypothetical protein PV-S19_0003 [Pacmanvirus S19]